MTDRRGRRRRHKRHKARRTWRRERDALMVDLSNLAHNRTCWGRAW